MRVFLTALALLALAGNLQAQEPADEPSPSPAPTQTQPQTQPQVPAAVVALPPPPAELVRELTGTWPFTIDMHVLLGAEFHEVGTPVAFGIGAEALWHGWVGLFASLLASEGTPVLVASQKASLADRVSVPLGLAIRPGGAAAARHNGWAWRLVGGIGLQAGVTIEHLRSSDDDTTTAGLHLGLAIDVPIYGGPIEGGVAFRIATRLIVTPAITLEPNKAIQEPIASGQFFAGFSYTP